LHQRCGWLGQERHEFGIDFRGALSPAAACAMLSRREVPLAATTLRRVGVDNVSDVTMTSPCS
jgi:hypothetical protein